MEGIRKQWIKENRFEAGWTSRLYELPRFHWSFYVFKWPLWSAIYGSDTIPHKLLDSVISRAFRGNLIISGALSAAIISVVYECPLQDQVSAEESEKDAFSNKLPESKLDKVSEVFGQLKEQNISLEEVANDTNVKEAIARISEY